MPATQADLEDTAVRLILTVAAVPLRPATITAFISALAEHEAWIDWQPARAVDVIPALLRIGAQRGADGRYGLVSGAGHAADGAGAAAAALRPFGGAPLVRGVTQ